MDAMERAGYLQRNGLTVLDEEGVPREIVELRIHGATLGMRLAGLHDLLSGGFSASVERIRQNWMQYLDGTAGNASISRSGRALNIELVNGDRFTLSLDSLRAVLTRDERFAPIAELPHRTVPALPRDHTITEYSGLFSPRYQVRRAGGEAAA
jgi:hypothetical protein